MMSRKVIVPRFFIRIPMYVSQFLRTKYMGADDVLAPIVLPWRASAAGEIVYKRLVCNAAMEKLTPTCYSAQMFNMDPYDIPESRVADFPSDDVLGEFSAISIPEPHYYNGVWIDDNEMMQLDQKDSHEFIQAVCNEFWNELDLFWNDYSAQFAIDHPGCHCSFFDCLLDFMEFWHVSLDEEEAVYRAVMRRKKKLKDSESIT